MFFWRIAWRIAIIFRVGGCNWRLDQSGLRLDVSAKQSLKVSDTLNSRDANVYSMSRDFLPKYVFQVIG
jgi:hypothetical protein